MKCSKCGRELGENETTCKFCAGETKKKEKEKFVVNIESDEFTKAESHEKKAKPTEVKKSEGRPAQKRTSQPTQRPQGQRPQGQRSQSQRPQGQRPQGQNPQGQRPQSQRAPAQRPQTARRDRPLKREKAPLLAIKIISAFCAVVLVAVSVLSVKTDIFKTPTGNVPMALTKLSSEQTAEFERFAPGFTALFDRGFDSSKSVLDDVIDLFEPTDEGGLYAAVLSPVSPKDETDPLDRFSGGFCTVSPDDISAVAERLSLISCGDLNNETCYSLDGTYYFKDNDRHTDKKVVAVTDSKRLTDGGYYITADIYPSGTTANEDGTYTAQAEKTLYFEVQLKTSAVTAAITESADDLTTDAPSESTTDGETTAPSETDPTEATAAPTEEPETTEFIFKRISATPLFDSMAPTEEQTPEGTLEYTMRRTVVESKCSDGTLFAKYVVERPYFTDNTNETAVVINSIYDTVVADYAKQAETSNADKAYKNFISQGGNKTQLPTYKNTVVSVKYNADGFISFLERATAYTGLEKVTAVNNAKEEFTKRYGYEPESVDEENDIYLPTTVYEGYTYRISDGDFVKKDEFLGKDYYEVQTQLYDTYKKTYFPEGEGGESTVPETDDETAKAIYESAFTLGEKDVTFYFQNGTRLMPVTMERGEPAG